MIGDLVEQRQRGRSSAWYWRQTMSAIATSFVAEMWQHKLLAIFGGRHARVGWHIGHAPANASEGPDILAGVEVTWSWRDATGVWKGLSFAVANLRRHALGEPFATSVVVKPRDTFPRWPPTHALEAPWRRAVRHIWLCGRSKPPGRPQGRAIGRRSSGGPWSDSRRRQPRRGIAAVGYLCNVYVILRMERT
jgi:hypothetical protein